MSNYADPENTLIMETSKGQVVIECMSDVAPKHVERLKELSREGFYDGIVFHRVIDGFMAQCGCPDGRGTGGSSKPDLEAEFNETNTVVAYVPWRVRKTLIQLTRSSSFVSTMRHS
jgi:cyclophilin family peptidyl-prolyl cis-trans isomerase